MMNVNPESVRVIARKDFQDAVRSMLFWALSFFFFLLLAAITGLIWYFQGEPILEEELTTPVLVLVVSEVTRIVIPLIALILGWKAIAGEREAGSMKVLLSLPHSRHDVVLGKLIGRSLVLSLSLVIGFAFAAVVVAAFMGRFGIGQYVGLLVVSIVYGVAYVSIAVFISSLTRSTTLAGIGVFGVFLLFYVFWNMIATAAFVLVALGYIQGSQWTIPGDAGTIELAPHWALFLDSLDPGNAYANVLSLIVDEIGIDGMLGDADAFEETVFYLEEWFAVLVLLLWIVLPLAIALVAFDRADL